MTFCILWQRLRHDVELIFRVQRFLFVPCRPNFGALSEIVADALLSEKTMRLRPRDRWRYAEIKPACLYPPMQKPEPYTVILKTRPLKPTKP